MIAHRWQRNEPAQLWQCVPPEIHPGGRPAPGSCHGCGLIVTDEHCYRSFPGGEWADGPVSAWLNALVEQSAGWWAARHVDRPAVNAIGKLTRG